MQPDDLLAQVLRLPRPDRARIAERLLASIEEPDEEVAAAWAAELERRSEELDQGAVEPIAWEEVRSELLSELAERRARRTPS